MSRCQILYSETIMRATTAFKLVQPGGGVRPRIGTKTEHRVCGLLKMVSIQSVQVGGAILAFRVSERRFNARRRGLLEVHNVQ